MKVVQQIEVKRWGGPFSGSLQEQAVYALEHGQILYCPNLAFELNDDEQRFLSSGWRSGRRKNISYDPATDRLGGASVTGQEARELAATIARYVRVTR
ncbi:MAG TPA: Kdo hydroxylase family protein, partial [Pyrinomonadaceae bacterium]|nr:Kdo hydroxylase family protein [Pyrinomonadaceae bacterium]